VNAPLRSRLLAPFTAARAFQSRGAGASELQLNRPALSGPRVVTLPAPNRSTACSLMQSKCCLAGGGRLPFAGPALKRSAWLRVGAGVGRAAAHAAGGGTLLRQAPVKVGAGRRRGGQGLRVGSGLTPRSSGQPSAAAQLER
jgi:hypothetical protein